MNSRKKPFDKRGKAILKGKLKTCVTTKSNGGSQKKECQCAFTMKMLNVLPIATKKCYYKKKHINAIRGLCHGNIL